MSAFSDFDLVLKEINKSIEEPDMANQPEEIQLGYKIDRLISDLDGLCVLANNDRSKFDPHMIAVGRVVSRAQLLAGFLLARPYPNVRRLAL